MNPCPRIAIVPIDYGVRRSRAAFAATPALKKI